MYHFNHDHYFLDKKSYIRVTNFHLESERIPLRNQEFFQVFVYYSGEWLN